jgi:hypothetical protein
MNVRNPRRWTQFAVVVTLFLFGCSRTTPPPPVYTATPTGAGSAEMLVDDFKKAYAAGDTDAAMRLFYWSSADAEGTQRFWLRLFPEMFAVSYESMELVSPPGAHNSANGATKTALPIVAQLRIVRTTSTFRTEQDLMIGKNDHGFYFVPPIDK